MKLLFDLSGEEGKNSPRAEWANYRPPHHGVERDGGGESIQLRYNE